MTAQIAFAASIQSAGNAGFPDAIATVEEARHVVERERLPIIRSGPRWLDVHARLILAQRTQAADDVAGAAGALADALAAEREPSNLQRAA